MEQHYLDNSATTRVSKAAAERAIHIMRSDYGNPSSLHRLGFDARCMLEDARATIAKSLSAKPEEIYFTSGGTEGNNLAVFGAARAKKRQGNRIVTTKTEHPSVLEPMKALEREGFEVIYLSPNRSGAFSEQDLAETIDSRTILVSMMLVNNETGSIAPVSAAAKYIKMNHAPALLHTDAVQAYMKLPISVGKLGVDLLTVSGHKLHAPKGIGALYLSRSCRIHPLSYGGGQEKGIRPGTESTALAAAFETAVKEAYGIKESEAEMQTLNQYCREQLGLLDGITIHSSKEALPYILSFSAADIKAETMLHFLEERGVFVSSGSACGRSKPSHVLAAMQLEKRLIETALRVSFSVHSTKGDVDALVSGLKDGMEKLAKMR